MKKLIYSLVLVGAVLFAPLVLAAEGGIQISPLTYNFDLKPGETKSASVNITNQNSVDLNYVMEVELFTDVTNEGAPSFAGKNPEGVTTLADWFVFESGDKDGTIGPKEQKEVNFTISVPQGADPGGHYVAVFAKEIKKNAEGQTQLGVSSRVGTLVLVSIPGDVSKSAEITSFTHPKFALWGPIDFKMAVKNTGTVHYDSVGKVEIDPLLGSNKTIDLGAHTIIPKNTRTYEGRWQNKFPIGYYKVTAKATDGDKQEVTNSSSIIAIPLLILIPILGIIIAIIFMGKYLRGKYKIVSKS